MRALIKKTAIGSEYWDNKEKRIIFVPHSEQPDFEVTENPKSLLYSDKEENKETNDEEKNEKEAAGFTNEEGEYILFDSLTVPQLKEYAKENDIDIPNDKKKKDDIVAFLSEQ